MLEHKYSTSEKPIIGIVAKHARENEKGLPK